MGWRMKGNDVNILKLMPSIATSDSSDCFEFYFEAVTIHAIQLSGYGYCYCGYGQIAW
jgi:hypothetical protein